MNFGLRVISIVSIAGVLAWAANAAPLLPTGDPQSQGFGYGYGTVKVTICHIPPGNPDNAHTITVGAPAVPAHLAHGDTLGPCPEALAAAAATGKKHGKPQATEESATEQSSTGKAKKQKPEKGSDNASAGKQHNSKPDEGAVNASAGTQEKTNNGKSKKSETPTAESGTTVQVTAAPAPQETPKKPKKEKPNASSQSNGGGPPATPPGQSNDHGNGGGNGNAGGNGNGQGNGHNK